MMLGERPSSVSACGHYGVQGVSPRAGMTWGIARVGVAKREVLRPRWIGENSRLQVRAVGALRDPIGTVPYAKRGLEKTRDFSAISGPLANSHKVLSRKDDAQMYSHVMVGANDVDALVAFYDAVLGTLGLARTPRQRTDSPAGFIWSRRGCRWPQFAVRSPFDGGPATPGNGVQISFAAPSRQHVVAAWQIAIDHGGADEGGPGLRPQYNDDFFAAYCRDPEGNKLCFVHAGDLP